MNKARRDQLTAGTQTWLLPQVCPVLQLPPPISQTQIKGERRLLFGQMQIPVKDTLCFLRRWCPEVSERFYLKKMAANIPSATTRRIHFPIPGIGWPCG